MCARGLFSYVPLPASHSPSLRLGFGLASASAWLGGLAWWLGLAWLWLWLRLPAFDVRAVKRAEHRSLTWPKRRPCLSEASLGCVPRQARSAGNRCGLIASASVRRRDFLVPFWSFKKGLARAAGESSALALFACLAWPREAAKNRASALYARLTFVKSKHDSADALANGEAGPKGERRRRESKRHRRTRADAAAPRRSPALLA